MIKDETFGLGKEVRIYRTAEIKALFTNANSFTIFPFKVLHIGFPNEEGVKLAISVPKRLFKKAVDRNLLKRRTREAYRTNKIELKKSMKDAQKGLHFMLIYIAKEEHEFDLIQKKIILTLQRLQSIYAEDR